MRYIDTHIHLADTGEPSARLIGQMQAIGLTHCIAVSARADDWHKTASWADAFPNFITPAFGLHPLYGSQAPADWVSRLESYLKRYPNAMIGECGFDKREKDADFTRQLPYTAQQRTLAERYRRPLLIHSVHALNQTLELLEGFNGKVVFHGFNGRPDHLRLYNNIDFYVAVNKTFFNNKTCLEILKQTDPKRLLIETDAPYQGFATDLPLICRKIAEQLNLSERIVSEQLFQNSMELIKL